jgi:hypothetical protein
VARPLTKQEIHRVWASYLNPLKPSVPQIGDPQEADCIWTQAYSRVHYSEAQLPSIIGAFRKEANNDDERTIELIIKDGFDPGSANFKLAQLGTEMSERYAKQDVLHRIDQWEVPIALYMQDYNWFRKHRKFIHPIWPPFTGPTPNVKRGCIITSQKLGLTSPIELAAPVMIARAVMHIWALGWNCIVPSFEMTPEETFVSESCQYQTRGMWNWNPWNCWLIRETYGRYGYCTVVGPMVNLIKTGKAEKLVSFYPPNYQEALG